VPSRHAAGSNEVPLGDTRAWDADHMFTCASLMPQAGEATDKRGGRAATLGSGVSRVDPRMPESTNAAGGGDEQIRISQIRYPVLFEGREGEGSGRATHPARSRGGYV